MSELHSLLEKDGWFNKYTIMALKGMGPLEAIKCLLETLEDEGEIRKRPSVKYRPLDAVSVLRIRKSPNLKHINLLGF
jgi:hypothetical protein